jgi:glycosyltransferase involved in cell wall biosynthesis
VLYVSLSMPYKHQIEVAIAVSRLRSEGIPIKIRFVGPFWGGYGRQLTKLINRLDPKGECLLWTGGEKFEVLHDFYRNADAFVFASSCENLPNILIEAMAAGLPVACSNRGPMPEVLGEAGIYFDPDDPDSIANSLRQLASDTELRTKLADMAWQKANHYSWERCAHETFGFIARVFNQVECVNSKPSN